jgi:hypothetical protein
VFAGRHANPGVTRTDTVKRGYKMISYPAQKLLLIEVALLNTRTGQIPVDSVRRKNRVRIATSNILGISSWVTHGRVHVVLPPSLLIKYRLIQEDELLCLIQPHRTPIDLPKILILIYGEGL